MRIAVNVDVAICLRGDWVVIVRGANEEHAAGKLSLVGGCLDQDANSLHALEDTARREVREEIGLELTGPLHYVESTTFTCDQGNMVLNIVFVAQTSTGTPTITSPEEVAAIRHSPLNDLLDDPECPEWTRRGLRAAAEKLAELPTGVN